MRDTPPEVMHRYREMLLARPPEARLRMGCSMSATARALVRASVLAQDPQASPAAVRRALFLRFYGHEFDAAERERIMDWLARPEAPPQPHGPARRVPVNWADLEMALTTNAAEWTCYLDVRSGELLMVLLERDDEEWPSAEEVQAGLMAGHLIRVEPLGPRVEYRWMADFVTTVDDGRLRDRLEVALAGRGAFRRFKSVLVDFPAERERWLALRGERLRAAARRWLADHDIEPTSAPPASHKS